MNNFLKMIVVAVVTIAIVLFITNRDDDFGDKVEEAVNDAGRAVEDATEG